VFFEIFKIFFFISTPHPPPPTSQQLTQKPVFDVSFTKKKFTAGNSEVFLIKFPGAELDESTFPYTLQHPRPLAMAHQ